MYIHFIPCQGDHFSFNLLCSQTFKIIFFLYLNLLYYLFYDEENVANF